MLFARFSRDRKGGIAPLLALAIVPVLGAVGAAVDYSRASASRTALQSALDSAMLYAAKGDSATWQQTAATAFTAMVTAKNEATVATPTFSVDGNGNYVGQVAASVPARVAGILGVTSIQVNASASVKPYNDPDNSCILTLDKGAATTHVSMNFGGAPNIQLAGCSTRSNTSLNCNGHGSGSAASIAAGNATNCSNSKSSATPLPDIYETMAANISKLCGSLNGGVTWTPGTVPAAVKTQVVGGRTEYHVCGTLTVSGSGYLTGSSPTSDSLIVIENGGLKLSVSASISTKRTAIVLTGPSSTASIIDFPNGNGQSAALSLSPGISSDNPWRGIALYQDPVMTNVANNWGPGATFNADGIVYLPNSDVQMRGVAGSGNYQCSKFVSKTFSTNGSVVLNFAQTTAGCETIGMKQWSDVPLHLVY